MSTLIVCPHSIPLLAHCHIYCSSIWGKTADCKLYTASCLPQSFGDTAGKWLDIQGTAYYVRSCQYSSVKLMCCTANTDLVTGCAGLAAVDSASLRTTSQAAAIAFKCRGLSAMCSLHFHTCTRTPGSALRLFFFTGSPTVASISMLITSLAGVFVVAGMSVL